MSGIRLTLGWVATAVGGTIGAGDPAMEIGPVVTDTRAIQAGDFFVALPGERFDGHAFVDEAIRRGACGVMVEHGRGGSASPAVEVTNTVEALQELARHVRRASGARVVAITGSAGKTTTKEAAAEFLSARFRVVKNKGNLNNHIGLPLSLLQLRTGPEVAVMELGMNHPGEIRTLVGIADPDVRVWTNVGDAHLGFFDSPDAIADAKAEILEGGEGSGVLVANADDPRVSARVGRFAGRVVTFGTGAKADVRATDIVDLGTSGMRARLTTSAGERLLETPLLGRGNLANVLAATAVALHFEVSLDDVVQRAARLRPAERRGAVRRLSDGVVLIDDSYNSSPRALLTALDVVARDTRAARRVAVVGEMLELGAHSVRLHEECGTAAARSGLGLLVAIGGESARALGGAAIDAGMPASSVSYFETSEQAADAVAEAIRPGDLVLVKGSRGVRTDRVADRIGHEFA